MLSTSAPDFWARSAHLSASRRRSRRIASTTSPAVVGRAVVVKPAPTALYGRQSASCAATRAAAALPSTTTGRASGAGGRQVLAGVGIPNDVQADAQRSGSRGPLKAFGGDAVA